MKQLVLALIYIMCCNLYVTKKRTKVQDSGVPRPRPRLRGSKTKTKTKTLIPESRDVSRPRLKSREPQVWQKHMYKHYYTQAELTAHAV